MYDILGREVSVGDIIAISASYIPRVGFLEQNSITLVIFIRKNDLTTTIGVPLIPKDTPLKKLLLVKMDFLGDCIIIDNITDLHNWQEKNTPHTANALQYYSEKIKKGFFLNDLYRTAKQDSP